MSKLTVNVQGNPIELEIAYQEGQDELVVFLHGLGCSKECFKDVWNSSELRQYALLTFDFVGYGDSAQPLNFSYEMEDQAQISFLLLNKFLEKKIHIVAHSMGGAIGLLLAEKLKDRLASYTSVEGNLIAADCGYISRETTRYTLEEFTNQMMNQLIETNRLSDQAGSRLWAEMLEKCHPHAFYKSALSLVKWSDSQQLLEKYNQLNTKKQYIFGDQNAQMEVLQAIGKSEVTSISNSGHSVMTDNPVEFYKTLYGFLKK